MRWASGDGVSPSAERSRRAGPGSACYGAVGRSGVGRGVDWQGLRWQHGGPTGLPCRLHWWTGLGWAQRCTAGPGDARLGLAGRGGASEGKGHRRWHGGFGLPATLTKGGRGTVGRGRRAWARHVWVRRGAARAADSSTEPLRGFPAALFGGQTRQGSARHVAARRAWERHGVALSGKAR
jgi:hypothetical protein